MSTLSPPKTSPELQVSFPIPHVIQLTFNRPKALNAMTPGMQQDLETVLDWFESEPELWVAIFTGAGRIFCAGADLVAWSKHQTARTDTKEYFSRDGIMSDVHGFASISRRKSSKPIIAAVNGGTFGGGTELILNCDLVVASEDAVFALPEVKRGVVAVQGGIPRLANIAGHQLASEMLLTGKPISAQDAYSRFHFVNKLAPPDKLLPVTYELASLIISNSPDAVQATKHALVQNQLYGDTHEAFINHLSSPESKRVYFGDNIQEGLKAFVEKRKPSWKNPAKL